jgi:pimeloyl-ACP methyl ester carboxylesterase
MRTQTLYRELTAAGILIASYPLNWVVERAGVWGQGDGKPVIFIHGLGGNRANLLSLAAYVRMAGFCNIVYFQYPRTQTVANSAEALADLVERAGGGHGVHLVGHSLGGAIARRFSHQCEPGTIRSLITLGSPYRYDQRSPQELAIFGEDDSIVPPPVARRMRLGAVKQAVVLRKTGHLGVLYHGAVLRLVAEELYENGESH